MSAAATEGIGVHWSPYERGRDVQVDVPHVLREPKAALQQVLSSIPGWSKEAASQVSVLHMSGAITNLVYRCSSPAAKGPHATVMVRVFGRGGKLFSQREERNIFMLASDLGLGPQCLVQFANGRVEQFLPGESLTAESMQEPAISAAIAAAMAHFHVEMLGAPPPGSASAAAAAALAAAGSSGGGAALRPAIWGRLRKWLVTARELCGAELQAAGLGALEAELEQLEAGLHRRFPLWVGFCHNDLQYGNMLLLRGGGVPTPTPGGSLGAAAAGDTPAVPFVAAPAHGVDSDLEIRLIDFEYASLNDCSFDVANHFCEWSADYHADEAHLMDFGRLPGSTQRAHFCHAYVAAMAATAPPALQQAQPQKAQQAQRPRPQASGDAQQPEEGDGVAAAPAAKRRAVADVADGSTEAAEAAAAAAGAGTEEEGSASPEAALRQAVLGTGNGSGGSGAALAAAAALLEEKALGHVPVSHIKWALWGFIQAKLSDVDFDYLSYAQQRTQQYHLTKGPYLEGGTAEGSGGAALGEVAGGSSGGGGEAGGDGIPSSGAEAGGIQNGAGDGSGNGAGDGSSGGGGGAAPEEGEELERVPTLRDGLAS